MTRISPVWVLLIAAGCANAGITDWLNPFRMFGGKNQQNGGAGGVQQNPKGPGHRGTRQLYPASGPGPSAHGSHGPLGSPAGHLDDGFKPSFPPGFANPPSHSPNLNPFAVAGGHGPSGAASKGPLLPSQLTVQHSPGHPSGGSYRPRGRFGFGRPRNPPPHAHASASNIGGPSESPSHDGPQQDYNDYGRQPGGPNGIEFEDHQGGGPQIGGAPQRGPPGPPQGYHHRPAGRPRGRPGPPPSFAGGRPGGHHFGRPMHGGPHGSGAPQGPPGGPSFLQGGDDSRGPFGSNGNGPAQFSGGPPAGPGGPGGRPGGSDTFFAPSPGAYNNGPDEDSQSPFSGAPQSGNLFNQGAPEGLFGGEQGAPQGPPQGGPGGQNGPQGFFGANGNDYPEQFEGGSRETRNPQQRPQHDDFRPQPQGPPEGMNINGGSEGSDQNPGFYGALHNEQHSPLGQPPQFFGGPQQQSQGAPSLDASGGHSPFMNPNGAQNIFGSGGPGGPQREESPSYPPPGPRGRKPPVRLGLRNPLAAAFQGSSSNVPSYGVPLMMSATGGKPTLLPVPKGRGIRPFIRKPGVILPLASPRDPNYRPMLFAPSNMSPVTASFEPDTAASGHGGYGDVGLSHNGDRILYHVAGHQGPKSYRFGFDTGKGHNRIFRFEEKDGKGYVKGKYGFYDKHGKLNLINYQAHPQHGYHAERGHSHGHY